MKNLFLLLVISIFVSVSVAVASDLPENRLTDATLDKKIFQYSILKLERILWNETMSLQLGGQLEKDSANFTGLNISYENLNSYELWDLAAGFNFSTGLATGGGNGSLLLYQKGNQSWKAYGGFVSGSYRATPRTSIGIKVPLFFRSVSWPTGATGISADSGRNFNTGLLLNINYRLTKRWDFNQNIGFLNLADGSTIWSFGLGYRF